MKIEILIEPENLDRPDHYALRLVVTTQNLVGGGDVVDSQILQAGYATPEDAFQAFLQCLTEPPTVDLSAYATTEELTAQATLREQDSDLIAQLANRIAILEAAVAGRTSIPPAAPAASTAPVRPPLNKPAPIRRTRDLPEEQQNLGARVHGRVFGGPIRRSAPPTPDEEG